MTSTSASISSRRTRSSRRIPARPTSSCTASRSLMAKNYVDNLSEEVKKGMREKADQGHWPSVAQSATSTIASTHRIDVDPVRGPLVARGVRAVCDRRLLAHSARRKSARDRPHPPRAAPADDQVGNAPDAAESDLHGRVPSGSARSLPAAHTTPLISRETFDAGAGGAAAASPARRYQKHRHAVHGSADVRPLRLHDDRGAEEGQVRLLPLHRLSRALRQHVHPRGTARCSSWRRRRRHPDSR